MKNYGNVYVASVSMPTAESSRHLIKCLKESESYDGLSLIICFSNCILHHLQNSIDGGRKGGSSAGKLTFESGCLLFCLDDPLKAKEGKNPLEIVSKSPQLHKLDQFLDMEVRFRELNTVNAERYQQARESLKECICLRYKKYQFFIFISLKCPKTKSNIF
jgi:pyruvate-ferredoxin/flavodoxin oxidoreductase